MEWTQGFKMVEIKFNDQIFQGFCKVSKLGEMTLETRKDLPIKPYDHLSVGVDDVIVKRIRVYQSRLEIDCEPIEKSDIVKANQTLKKFKKTEKVQKTIIEEMTDGE
tara:strand:+ start:4473 stop:4793 length:321 start_codon:yes stop_codon:yes gene_type:complete